MAVTDRPITPEDITRFYPLAKRHVDVRIGAAPGYAPANPDTARRGRIKAISAEFCADIDANGPFAPGDTLFAVGHYTEDRLVWFDFLTSTLDDIMRECGLPEERREQQGMECRWCFFPHQVGEHAAAVAPKHYGVKPSIPFRIPFRGNNHRWSFPGVCAVGAECLCGRKADVEGGRFWLGCQGGTRRVWRSG